MLIQNRHVNVDIYKLSQTKRNACILVRKFSASEETYMHIEYLSTETTTSATEQHALMFYASSILRSGVFQVLKHWLSKYFNL